MVDDIGMGGCFFVSSRRRHTISVSAFLLNRSSDLTTSTTSIDIMGLQAAYANLHTDQERDYFMQRYLDVISSFGGKTSYDADNQIGRASCRERVKMSVDVQSLKKKQ